MEPLEMSLAAPSLLAVVAQATTEGTNPYAEYIIFAVVGVIVLFLFVRGLRKPRPEQMPEPPPAIPLPSEREHLSDEEIEAEARQAFQSPLVHAGEGGKTHVRLRSETEAPPPTIDEAAQRRAEREAAAPVEKATEEPDAPPAAEKPAVAPVEQAGKTLREGLSRTHDGFVKKLGKLFGRARTLDDDLLAELEEALFTADIGVRTSQKLVDLVHQSMGRKEFGDPAKVWEKLKAEITATLQVEGAEGFDYDAHKPFVVMVVGVNGAGKTTSIGKIAHTLTGAGKKVLLAAGDTFRAAAVEQLEVWGQRAGVPVVKGKENQDPASVVFDAVARAEREGFDVCIADTAGRLQAKKELMDELAKVHRVIGKAVPGAPHEVWLVLDATNGQNAISQAKEFTQAVDVTGIVLTKLDGTAKGGVVIGICDEMKLPVRYIGIGEKVEDLRAFDPRAFAEALFAEM